jgi:hypothetical protein
MTLKALGDIKLNTSMNQEVETVSCIEIDEAFRTLGVPLTPFGCQKQAKQILCQHSLKYTSSIT